MLTVCLTTNTSKTVALYNALETVTFGSTNGINKITFYENILNADFFSKLNDAVKLLSEISK